LRDARLRSQFHDLEDHIENGWTVPDEFYRLDVDQNRDRLLDETGIKHLHLNGRGSDAVVYLIELDDKVIFLRIANHAYLEDEPRGIRLLRALGLR
jgi:hypothetical protein